VGDVKVYKEKGIEGVDDRIKVKLYTMVCSFLHGLGYH
jgi:hypothetical protein